MDFGGAEDRLILATRKTHLAYAAAVARLRRGRAVEKWTWPTAEAWAARTLREKPHTLVDLVRTASDFSS